MACIYHCKEDKEAVDLLATAGNPFTTIDGLHSRQPSCYNIEFLENPEVYGDIHRRYPLQKMADLSNSKQADF